MPINTLFAPSCGSVGDFTDIQQDAEGNLAITSEMQCYNFSVRRLNGDWYAHVYPFDTKFFRKVHPAGALLFSGVHSHLMLLQYILINLPTAKNPIWVISEVPKYWLEYDGTLCLDEAHRWKSTATIEFCVRMAYTLSQIRSRLSLETLFICLCWLPSRPPVTPPKKKKKHSSDAGGVLLGCSLAVLVVLVVLLRLFGLSLSLPKVASHGGDVGDDSWLKWYSTLLTVLRRSRILSTP